VESAVRAWQWVVRHRVKLLTLAAAVATWWFVQSAVGALVVVVGAGVWSVYGWAWERRRAMREAGMPAPSAWSLLRAYVTERRRVGCEGANLKGGLAKVKVPPTLLGLAPTLNGDFQARVTAKYTGVTGERVRKASADLASIIGCRELTVEEDPDHPHLSHLRFYFTSPLDRVWPVAELPESPRGYLSYGVRADGSPACVVANQSVLLGGMTRHGKSNTVWALLADVVRQGLYVDLYVSDPKEGIELYLLGQQVGKAGGRVRVVEYVTGDRGGSKETMAMVGRVVARMKARGAAHAGAGNEMGISKDNPLIVVLLDELLEVAKELRTGGADSPPGTILYKGSALGVVVWANTQIATKNVLGDARDLFPQSLAVATKSTAATDVILGDGAASGGADNHKLQGKRGRGNSASEDGPVRPFRTVLVRDGWDQFKEHYDQASDDRLLISQGRLPAGMARAGGTPPRRSERCAVYRLYGFEDTDGSRELVYIGKAVEPADRIKQHEADWRRGAGKEWWPDVDLGATVLKWHPSEAKAIAAEEAAIKAEWPRENDLHNGGNPIGRRAKFRLLLGGRAA